MDYVGSLIDKHPAWFTFACLLLGGFVWQGAQTWRGLASRRWPSVQGWVHHSTFGQETIVTGGGPSVQYQAFVEYTYQVGETEYTGRRRRFGFQPDAVEPQPHQGEWVTVWYDPRWPIEATLEPGIRPENLVVLLGCFLGRRGGARNGSAAVESEPPSCLQLKRQHWAGHQRARVRDRENAAEQQIGGGA